ncbi:MAG TPA: tetratricopeptide repeat protein, partial [Flavitalea sp.]|nr:tetratricopeptide repeat protein [Flavitalea sp.]
MKKILFALALLFLVNTITAQDTYRKINNALRYLKVGNTLREAQQYDLSEKYLRQGLQTIADIGNRYWEAAAYEQLGLLYKDQDKSLDAARYFNKALAIYRQLNMGLSTKALEQMLGGAEGKEQSFAGIEIGNKGVKLSVVSIVLNNSGEVEYVLKTDTSTNPEPAALTPQSQMETAEAIKKFMDIAKNVY